MTKRTRKLLLITMILIFAVFAPVVILYSIGYRLNIDTWEITETGALSLRTKPSGASITIDGKDRGTTPKTMRSVVPREYNIQIEKDGYHFWGKALAVEAKLVTEARDIILPPLQLPLDIVVDAEFDEITFSPSGNWLIGKTGAIIFRHRVNDGMFMASASLTSSLASFSDILWSPDEQSIILPGETSTILATFDGETLTTKILAPNFFWGPEENNALFRLITSQTGERFLQRVSIDSFEVESFLTPVTGVAVTSNSFLVRIEDPTPHLELWDNAGRSLGVIILLEDERRDPLLQPVSESTRDLLVLRNGETGFTWVYDGREELWHYLGDDIISSSFSQNEKKVAFLTSNGTLTIRWFLEEIIQPRRRQNDVEIITKSASNLSSYQWMPEGSPYLLITQGNRIWLTELDGRDVRNRWSLLTLRSPKIYTFKHNQNIYIVSGGVAYKAHVKQ